MDRRHKEKLSHLHMLIQMIRSDKESNDLELEYMLRIAARLNLSKEDVLHVLEEEVEFCPPIHEHQRIVLFHQLLILIYIDGKIDEKELGFAQGLGLKMGLILMQLRKFLQSFTTILIQA